jgi:hypothetical protein
LKSRESWSIRSRPSPSPGHGSGCNASPGKASNGSAEDLVVVLEDGEDDDERFGRAFFEEADAIEAAHAWQADIEQD